MTDAISNTIVNFLDEHVARATGKPFFMYVAYTAPHWQLHALKEEIDHYQERYLKGWDIIREQRFRRQQEMGLFPGDIQMNKRDPAVPDWETISSQKQEEIDRKRVVKVKRVSVREDMGGRG